MPSIKLLPAMLLAIVVFGACASSSSANKLSLSNRNFRVVFGEPVGEPPPDEIGCAVTLEGSFHYGTMVKATNALIGFISRASLRPASCRGGKMTILAATLPWHVAYESFSGTLPRITQIATKVVGMGLLGEFENFPGSSCLIRTTTEHPARAIFPREERGALSFRWDETVFIPDTGGFCFEPTLGVFGTASVTRLGNTSRITLTLI
jgi:hypothetical protein